MREKGTIRRYRKLVRKPSDPQKIAALGASCGDSHLAGTSGSVSPSAEALCDGLVRSSSSTLSEVSPRKSSPASDTESLGLN